MKPLDLSDMTFLRHFQDQIDLVLSQTEPAPETAEFPVLIDRVRTYIALGNYGHAKELLKTASPLNFADGADYAVEILHVLMHERRFFESFEIGRSVVHQKGVSVQTKQTLLLQLGECLIQLEMHSEARKILLEALEFSIHFPYAMSSLQAFVMMIKLCVAMNDKAQAEHFLGRAEDHLHELGFEKYSAAYLQRLHSLRRARFVIEAKYGTKDRVLSLLLGNIQICRWLDLQDKLFKNQSDLNLYIQRNEISNHARLKNQIVFSGWSFLKDEHLILLFAPKTIIHLDSNQLTYPLLCHLQNGEIEAWALYEKVWQKPYHHEESEAIMRVHLSRLRKLLPPGAVNYTSGRISLR